MSADDLLYEVEDGVCRLTLNRPQALNAITPDMRERLIKAFGDASGNPGVRAVLLTGTGRAFCSGADLRAAADAQEDGAAPRAGDIARLLRNGAQRLIAAVLDCERPVIAAVNGTAAGIGCHLALACDLVLTADGARFIEVFARRGLVPDGGGAYLLTRLVGPQRAKELMFFGDDLPADEAARLGLVNRVVADGELASTADHWARRLAAGPTLAHALTKRLVNRALEGDRASCFEAEALAQEINMTARDAREGLRAFAEGRRASFEGR
ncbi:enoyl-CoA hydratase/isomerase family protein [Spirillospora sp. CA-142024]|uniref:enoyl-CoA hydratase/isomerase family protein n=1 Tax=Spirillospora sp. CA-142024 TaxID=3240036 RepID=UPI003D8C5645